MAGPHLSGKSSVLFGQEFEVTRRSGMLPRFVSEIFDRSIGKRKPDAVEISMYAIVDERLFDLLDPGDPTLSETKSRLKLRWSRAMGTFVHGLSKCVARSGAELAQLVHEGIAMQALLHHMAGRGVNASAAHLVVALTMSVTAGGKSPQPIGKTTFVEVGDLTASLFSRKHDAAGSDRMEPLWRRTEASRTGLQRCASALSQLEYRDGAEAPTLPSSEYQQCALSFVLHSALSRGLCCWIGCLSPVAQGFAPPAHSASALVEMLDVAKACRVLTHPCTISDRKKGETCSTRQIVDLS